MSFPFKYCYNFTDREVTAIAFARGITSAVCGVTSFLILTLVSCCCHRVCGTVVKRSVVGLIAVNVPYQLVLALHRLHFIHYFQPDQENFCKADGYFDQYLESVQVLLTLGICLMLFFKVCGVTTFCKCRYEDRVTFTCCGDRKMNLLEIGFFVTMFSLPLLVDWIPFTTNSYGPFGPYCWIRILENDCSVYKAGTLKRILLWDVPIGLLGLLTLVLFIASLCLLGYAIKNAKANKVTVTESMVSLALMSTLYLLQTVSYLHTLKPHQIAFWVLNAISIPLSATVVPLVLLLAVHFPLSSTITRVCCNCRGRTHTMSDEATVHASSDIGV